MVKRSNYYNGKDGGAGSSPVVVRLAVFALIGLLFVVNHNLNACSPATLSNLRGDEFSSQKKSRMDLPPATTSIVIHVGTNLQPIMPRATEGPCALTLAFEPIVADEIPKHPQLHVIPAAVSDTYDITTMYKYNKQSMSSSLSKAATSYWWNTGLIFCVPFGIMRGQ